MIPVVDEAIQSEMIDDMLDSDFPLAILGL
jgi:hypothetical protein